MNFSRLLISANGAVWNQDWSTDYPLNSLSFLALFLLQFVFLWQGSRYFRKREMSTLCQELEGRSWNWTRQLPVLLKQVNLHSGLFLAILTLGYAATLCGYFIISDLEAVDGMMVRRHSTLEKSIRCSRFVLPCRRCRMNACAINCGRATAEPGAACIHTAATTAEPSAEFKPTRRLVAQVFYVSRVLFGFYMNGVVFCMPILFRYSILTGI